MLKNPLHRIHRFGLLMAIITIIVLAIASLNPALELVFAQTVDPTSITLREDGPAKKVIVKDENNKEVTDPQFEEPAANDFVRFDKIAGTFSPLKAGETNVELKYKVSGNTKTQTINIRVLPGIAHYSIKHGGIKYDNPEQTIGISRGAKWSIEIEALDADGNPVEGVQPKVTSGQANLALSSTTPYQIEAKNIGKAEIVLTADNVVSPTFKFEIRPPIKLSSITNATVPNIEILEGNSRELSPAIKNTSDADVNVFEDAYGASIVLPPNDYVELIGANKLSAKSLDSGVKEGKVTARLNLPIVAVSADSPPQSLDQPFVITVRLKGVGIYFDPPTQILFPNGTARINAYFKDRRGINRDDEYRVTDWRVADIYKKYIALAMEGNSVTVISLDPDDTDADQSRDQVESSGNVSRGNQTNTTTRVPRRAPNRTKEPQAMAKKPRAIPIEATAQSITGDETITGTAYVLLRDVTKFQMLSVKLNVMDHTTAKDLYGGVAADEYYIVMVRLFNDLKDDETKKYTGASIIVYSGSIEVAVNLEKQYDKSSKSAKKVTNPPSAPGSTDSYIADGRWYEVDPEADIKDSISDDRYVSKPPTNDEITLGLNDDPVCKGTITYRPLMFEMVVNTVDRREGRSLRSKVFDTLELVGIGTSFSSAIRFPRPGRDLPIISDRFTNLLVPGLEKIFPSLKEQHRQNIVSQVMKPLEEVPFGSDITRVLFIPKRAIRGIVNDHKARISQICPYYFKVKVAVVDKTGQTTVEQGVRR